MGGYIRKGGQQTIGRCQANHELSFMRPLGDACSRVASKIAGMGKSVGPCLAGACIARNHRRATDTYSHDILHYTSSWLWYVVGKIVLGLY
jgi:hypothetical protein